MKTGRIIIFSILLLILGITELSAHPHMFIGVQPTIKAFDSKELLLNVRYYIDKLNSRSILISNDKNYNNKLEKDEQELLIKRFKEMLEKDNYYMHSLINGKVTQIKPEQIKVYIKSIEKPNSKKVYIVVIDFDVKISTNFKQKGNEVRLLFMNKTYFCALNPISKIITGKKIKLIKNQILKSKSIFVFSFDLYKRTHFSGSKN